MLAIKTFSPNETTKFYNKLNTRLYIFGLPDFWIEDVKLPKTFVKIYNVVVKVFNVALASFVAMVFLSPFTQNNLNHDQRYTLIINAFMIPTVYFYYLMLIYRRTGIREILYEMGVLLKEVHNDKEVEKQMIKNVQFFANFYFWCVIIPKAYTGIKDDRLVAVVTAWPDVTDKSQLAHIVRCIFYVIGCFVYLRTIGSHVIIFMIVIGLSHQFKNTQSYFYSLSKIFDHFNLSQEEKEDKFEITFKAGIKMHATTLWCTKQCQILCRMIFNGQAILVTIVMMPFLGDSMKPENSRTDRIFFAMIGIIYASFLWCCAGNIKVEASKVSDAMYSSGWQNCFGKSSVRVRKLVVIAMTQAQKPVVLKAFNSIELSYEAFWNLIMSAYTAFILFY